MHTLLAYGVDIEAAAHGHQFGRPLSAACAHGHSEASRLMIKYAADVNAADALGSTPLHLAAAHGQREALEVLLAAGADLSFRDAAGRTAWQVAANRGGASGSGGQGAPSQADADGAACASLLEKALEGAPEGVLEGALERGVEVARSDAPSSGDGRLAQPAAALSAATDGPLSREDGPPPLRPPTGAFMSVSTDAGTVWECAPVLCRRCTRRTRCCCLARMHPAYHKMRDQGWHESCPLRVKQTSAWRPRDDVTLRCRARVRACYGVPWSISSRSRRLIGAPSLLAVALMTTDWTHS